MMNSGERVNTAEGDAKTLRQKDRILTKLRRVNFTPKKLNLSGKRTEAYSAKRRYASVYFYVFKNR